ncbi:hypothetical protein BHYA_0161g00200 [Botrytis hyacinthi]|uniref:Uncharacterized protein n=1 Tax=Botrytis hyacinthi TaxID=278943 RepID=A0A4Z1GNZ1_9HELO|nr:hypothetical protein BHYA_0161g00200 [Botrytis hyacinthi]
MANLEQRYALLENEMESEREPQGSDHSSLKTTDKNSNGLNLVSRATAFLVTNTNQVPAGLKHDIPVPWSVYGSFDNRSDPEATDEEWEKINNLRFGVIALSDSYVEEKGLHKAQRLSWDDSKWTKICYCLSSNSQL